MVAGRAGGVGGGGGGGLEFNTYLFTAGPTPIYTSQPFSLHCNKKFIHAAGGHHGSRQNIRPYRTPGSCNPLSSLMPGGLNRNRINGKRNLPGLADSGRVLAKICKMAVRPCFYQWRRRLVPTTVDVKNQIFLADFMSSHWYRHDSGWEPYKFSSGYIHKKIRKTKSVQCFADFFDKSR